MAVKVIPPPVNKDFHLQDTVNQVEYEIWTRLNEDNPSIVDISDAEDFYNFSCLSIEMLKKVIDLYEEKKPAVVKKAATKRKK